MVHHIAAYFCNIWNRYNDIMECRIREPNTDRGCYHVMAFYGDKCMDALRTSLEVE